MKKLIELLSQESNYQSFGNLSDKYVKGFSQDSRKLSDGLVYVARKGAKNDGHEYIDQVIQKGINIILCESMPVTLYEDVCYIRTDHLNSLLASMLNEFYNHPTDRIKLVGITGTNGKTSVATLLYDLFESLGYKAGLISTIKNKIHNLEIASTHTTPEIISLYELISRMDTMECDYVFMEVSSHAIDQARIEGLKFSVAVFTNLTQDHLDYHHTMLNYIYAKKKFFDHLDKSAYALVNDDDKNGNVMIQNTRAKVLSYSLKQPSNYRSKILDSGFQGMQIKYKDREWHTHLLGEFNAYNLTAVIGVAEIFNISTDEILEKLSLVKPVEGRFDWIYSTASQKYGVVDYAHTPDAIEKILKNLNSIRKNTQRIICVMGCGGNRDKEKRPIMGRIAAANSDQLILTSDNPRDEDPHEIIREIEAGINNDYKAKVLQIEDRTQAIRTASAISQKGDIVLIAGKGHENYQEIKGVKYPFNDKQILKEIL